MSRFDKILGKVASKKAAQEEEQLEEMGVGERILDILDRPGRATRAGIYAAQTDKPILDAIRAQLGSNPPEAPSGADIADRVSEDYNIQNPYALAGVATLADVADPTMFIPGGQVTKGGKVLQMAKGAGKSKKLAEAAKKLGISEDALRAFRQERMADNARKGASAANVLDDAKKAGGNVGLKQTAQEAQEQAMKEAGKKRMLKEQQRLQKIRDERVAAKAQKPELPKEQAPKEMSEFEKRLKRFHDAKAERLSKESL